MENFKQLWKEQRENSCRRILESAIVCFGKHGYTNTVIKDIADTAGLANGLVTKYFETKENLLSAAYQYATVFSYPAPKGDLNFVERLDILVAQTAFIRDTKPDYFRFFNMILNTSDLPENFHKTRRALFRQSPIYATMEREQKNGQLSEKSLYEQFQTFLIIMYVQLDCYQRYPDGQNSECNLFTDAVHLIDRNLKAYAQNQSILKK